MQAGRSQNPFLLVLLIVGLLGGLSLLRPGLTVAGVELRPVRLLADVLRRDPAATDDAVAALPPPNGTPAGSGALARNPAGAHPALPAQALPVPPPPADSAEVRRVTHVPNLGGLSSFVAALRQAKAGGAPVRIAYFGDSMIEGDMITGELRNLLQQEFGGAGVGFVPMTSITAEFRETIHQTFSDNWYGYDLKTQESTARCPLGPAGFSYLPRELPTEAGVVPDSSWTLFRAGPPVAYPTTRRLALARLLYGPGDARDEVVVTTDGHAVAHPLSGTARLNELVLRPGTPARQMRLAFAVHGPRPVYGVSFESPQGGVTLDNYSFRGNSGLSLTKIPFRQLETFGQVLDYRLIVLHYGVNIADARNKNYDWYDDAMTRVVDRMQRAFPNASILIVGMSDKASRIDGEFRTDPSVPRLLKAQRHLAERNHAAFWNLFEAMGGENSMVRWVEEAPARANRDYTHVNYRGGRQVARLLFDFLLDEYRRPAGAAPAAHPDSTAPPMASRADSARR